jgi:hypothetical protein
MRGFLGRSRAIADERVRIQGGKRRRTAAGSGLVRSEMNLQTPRPMLTYAVILALALAGYLEVSGWMVPAGAACLTLDAWRLWRLGPQSRIDWTSKTTTYFVTGVVANLILAALAFGAGRLVHILLA